MLALKTTGALLAGGQSSRMGEDKTLLAIGGKPMIERVIARLRPQVHRILISSNAEPQRYASYCLPVIADAEAAQEGPLAGLSAALAWARQETPDARYLATVPVDTPFLPADLVQRLAQAMRAAGATSAIAASGGRRHPVVGLWRLDLLGPVGTALKDGVRAMHRFAEMQGSAVTEFSAQSIAGEEVDPFFNVNTPADLARAEALCAALSSPEAARG